MADKPLELSEKLSWRFPRTFWYANGAELCERAAFYGMFITLVRYLNQDIGFTDVQTGWITGGFASILYFLPTFMGIMADKIGFKRALMIAFALLTAGYGLLGAFQLKATALAALTVIMFGGAIIKPVISGTVAKCSDSINRARAMSIFYMVVNIGAFSGKALAGVLNEQLGLQYINYYAAGMSFAALILVGVFYKNVDTEGVGKTVGEALRGLIKVVFHFRFLALILIVAGFWAIQGQLYAGVPTYVERVLGKGYKPEWIANINPLVVVLCVVPITHLVRKFRPESAIGVGLFIIPFTMLCIAVAPAMEQMWGASIALGPVSVHPLIFMLMIGIGLQGFAECFLSPKFLEYASKQAPKGEVGLYLGYQHLTTFFAWLLGFILVGYLLNAYCPDPRKGLDDSTRQAWRQATDPYYRFTLGADGRAAFETIEEGAEAQVPEAIRAVFGAHQIEIPASAVVHRDDAPDWKVDPEHKWQISWQGTEYTVEEEHLESHGEARKAGRERSRRDVVVYAPEERPRAELGPLPDEYRNAHFIWYIFAGIGFAAFFALLVFKFVTGAIDRRRGLVGDSSAPPNE
ncbi:MAG: MFS transporter [Planctomycetota bacterium]